MEFDQALLEKVSLIQSVPSPSLFLPPVLQWIPANVLHSRGNEVDKRSLPSTSNPPRKASLQQSIRQPNVNPVSLNQWILNSGQKPCVRMTATVSGSFQEHNLIHPSWANPAYQSVKFH